MIRRMLPLLIAALPAVLWAQEPKLVNCRTLAAAGNFVGPDEIIVNDSVCQKVKGSGAISIQSVQQSLPGAVISGGDPSVVDAAKAASKRVAAAQDAIKAQEQQEQSVPAEPVKAAEPVANPAVVPVNEPAKAPEAAPAPKQKMSLPAQESAPEFDASAKPAETKPATETASAEKPAESAAAAEPEQIKDPVAEQAAAQFTDAVDQIASREPTGAEPESVRGGATQSAAKSNEVESTEEARQQQPACGKSRWYKLWAKCRQET
jgi:hypothetical protein